MILNKLKPMQIFQMLITIRTMKKFRNQLEKKIMKQYIVDRCVGVCKYIDYRRSTQPLLTNKLRLKIQILL